MKKNYKRVRDLLFWSAYLAMLLIWIPLAELAVHVLNFLLGYSAGAVLLKLADLIIRGVNWITRFERE